MYNQILGYIYIYVYEEEMKPQKLWLVIIIFILHVRKLRNYITYPRLCSQLLFWVFLGDLVLCP